MSETPSKQNIPDSPARADGEYDAELAILVEGYRPADSAYEFGAAFDVSETLTKDLEALLENILEDYRGPMRNLFEALSQLEDTEDYGNYRDFFQHTITTQKDNLPLNFIRNLQIIWNNGAILKRVTDTLQSSNPNSNVDLASAEKKAFARVLIEAISPDENMLSWATSEIDESLKIPDDEIVIEEPIQPEPAPAAPQQLVAPPPLVAQPLPPAQPPAAPQPPAIPPLLQQAPKIEQASIPEKIGFWWGNGTQRLRENHAGLLRLVATVLQPKSVGAIAASAVVGTAVNYFGPEILDHLKTLPAQYIPAVLGSIAAISGPGLKITTAAINLFMNPAKSSDELSWAEQRITRRQIDKTLQLLRDVYRKVTSDTIKIADDDVKISFTALLIGVYDDILELQTDLKTTKKVNKTFGVILNEAIINQPEVVKTLAQTYIQTPFNNAGIEVSTQFNPSGNNVRLGFSFFNPLSNLRRIVFGTK